MSEHTPTPWAVETPLGDETPCIVQAGKETYEWSILAMTCAGDADMDEQGDLTLEEAAANAAFIVKACNSHDALVKALEKIACFDDARAQERLEVTGLYSGFDEPGSVEIARAALAALSQSSAQPASPSQEADRG